MRIIVGGEARKCGKTTVVCRILAGFPDQRWTAVKISPHMHIEGGEAWSLSEDDTEGDTRRYKEAGAEKAYLFCGDAEAGKAALMGVLSSAENWIVETTSAARLIEHDLALLVEAGADAEIKRGAFVACERVNALDGGLISVVAGRWKS